MNSGDNCQWVSNYIALPNIDSLKMPFTFAHPAILLPLLRKKRQFVSITGLVIGSITPDFESFINFGGDKIYSHRWSALLWFDMPLGVLLAFAFHVIVRDTFIRHLPDTLYARSVQFLGFDWIKYFFRHMSAVLISLFVGILSHFLWDAFTHLNLRYPDAITSTVQFSGHRLYIILQYFSSVLGLFLVGMAIFQLPKTGTARRQKVEYRYWWYVLISAFLLSAVTLCVSLSFKRYIDAVYLIKVVVSGLMYGAIFVSAAYQVFEQRPKAM